MPKLTINFHPEPNGKGEPIKQGQTFEGKADGSEPEPERAPKIRRPGLAMSMSITFDDPAADIDLAALPKPADK